MEVKHGKRSGSVVGYHFRQAVQRRPRDGMRYKDMAGGWNAFQTETDTMALEC